MLRRSICCYCGCSCSLLFEVRENKVVDVKPDPRDAISEGRPCIKGLTIHEVYDKGRILRPMIRRGGKLKKSSWDEALRYIKEQTKDLTPAEVFFAPSGKTTNEDCYALQKLARVVYKTNNVDGCCGRLCHAATLVAMQSMLGLPAMPYTINDIRDVDCLLVVGSNPPSNYPVIFNRIVDAKEKGAEIIAISPIYNEIMQFATLPLLIAPGSHLALLNYFIRYLIETKSYSDGSSSIEGFEELKKSVSQMSIDRVARVTGLKKSSVSQAAKLIAKAQRLGALHGMGITQHVDAVDSVRALLNLLLLKNGKILSCRGEVNVQGCGDMLCSPDIDPIFFMEVYGIQLPELRGKNMIEALVISPVSTAFVSGFNPAQSLPHLEKVHENLQEIFLIQMESHFNLTSEFADVILPTPTLIERWGTITNGERRVRLVSRVIRPLGSSRQEWEIAKAIAKSMGYGEHFPYRASKDVTREITQVVPAYRCIDVEKLYKGIDQFADKEVKFRKFVPTEFKGVEEVRSKKYPFLLTTFRSKFHFLTGELTCKSKTLKRLSGDLEVCYVSPEDAEKLRLKDGDLVRVSSRVGSVVTKVRIDDVVPNGTVAMHFHFERLLVNKLFPLRFDPRCFTPNYKVVAVAIEKVKSVREKQ